MISDYLKEVAEPQPEEAPEPTKYELRVDALHEAATALACPSALALRPVADLIKLAEWLLNG